MIAGLAVLLLFQLTGEAVTYFFNLPIPGPVIGMLLLFLVLVVRRRVPEGLDGAAQGLLKYLSLLFVPAGSGIVAYFSLIVREWLPITVALIGSTVITMSVTALTMRALVRTRPSISKPEEAVIPDA